MNGRTEPRKGDICICGIGSIGLITKDGVQEVEYPDGNKGQAYVGIHLTDKVSKVGNPWSSRSPRILCNVKNLEIVVLEEEHQRKELEQMAYFERARYGR